MGKLLDSGTVAINAAGVTRNSNKANFRIPEI